MNNLHINITWSRPQIPRGPITAFQLHIKELPNGNANSNSDVSNSSFYIIKAINLLFYYQPVTTL